MALPRDERRDPQPIGRGWEWAFLALAGLLLVLAVSALLGLGAAAALFGGGWVWPAGTDAWPRVLAGLASGSPGAGLRAAQVARLPGPAVVYGCVAAAELLAVGLLAGALAAWVRDRPAGGSGGMATRREAARVLGPRRLRAARPLIRPDLADADGADGARFDPASVGWRLGRSVAPAGVELWVRFDRTTGVYGVQGSGKTLDLLAPALLAHPGAAMATLTKPEDLLLTIGRREAGGRPVAVLDPFGLAPGLPELVWDPVAGCVDPLVAERRAKAFAAGTVTGSVAGGRADNAARFYAAETAKVLAGFFHAAALSGASLGHVLEWVANPAAAELPAEILRRHPDAAPFWDGLLTGALHGSADTVANTVTTVQQALSLFFQPSIRARCIPGRGRPATDLAALIKQEGTVYLLGREDPYAPAASLLTAVAEHLLDTALGLAMTSAHGRLTPSFLACLDELPSQAPLPTLQTRMANERALGISFIYAAQTWRQMVVAYGEDEARSLFGLTNTVVVFGGGKDVQFYREISELLGSTGIPRQTVTDGPGGPGASRVMEDVPVLRPEQLRLLPDRHALVVAENAPPILARLRRCVEGSAGRALLEGQGRARDRVRTSTGTDAEQRTRDAVRYAQSHGLHAPSRDAWAGGEEAVSEPQPVLAEESR